MANYVKFLRGTVTAYNNLANKDKDTLYFVTENKDSATGKLYLGSVELSGSINESGIVDYLSELKDVDTAGAVQNNILLRLLPFFRHADACCKNAARI